jgi:hypothetical protein
MQLLDFLAKASLKYEELSAHFLAKFSLKLRLVGFLRLITVRPNNRSTSALASKPSTPRILHSFLIDY